MSALDNARKAARELLHTLTGDDRPEWRTCFIPDGDIEQGPTSVAPVCTDDDHERLDGNVYSCCPDPVLDAESDVMAAYLVELLNADRGQR